jgi:hypothetical protein
MIVEQIRYFVREENREVLVEVRREIDSARERVGVPAGRILLADPVPDDAPAVIWQCGYPNDSSMGMAESSLIGDEAYEAARARLAGLVERIELEIYTTLDD